MEIQKKTIPIDGMKLRDAILEKGFTIAEAGEKIGYSKSGVANPIKRNEISPHILLLVDKVLGIPLEVYKKEEKKPEPEEDHEEINKPENSKKMYKMMLSATYAAVQSFCNTQLETIVKDACVRALREYLNDNNRR